MDFRIDKINWFKFQNVNEYLNNYEVVGILDIVLGISIILGNTDYTSEQLMALDINQDGNVDVLDVVELINYILR